MAAARVPGGAGAALAAVLIAAVAGADPAAKLDPRLAVLRGSAEPVRVWVEFQDKGPRTSEELRAALARAEASESPRRRARRARLGVAIDAHDLPVDAGHLESLRARGWTPHAVSRWLNRAAVLVPGHQLEALAAQPYVARVAPVVRSRRIAPAAPGPDPWPRVHETRGGSAAPPRHSPAAAAIDYGRLEPSMRQIQIPAVHDSGYTGAGVLVCVIDAGFNRHDTHEALRDRPVAPGHARDFIDGDSTVTHLGSLFGLQHGTWVLGVLTAHAPGEYVGAAPGIDLALARTENDTSETHAEELYWAQAAEWADSLGADLIQSSLGYFEFDAGHPDYEYADMDGRTTIVSRAAGIAASRGILIVNSAGNAGASPWHFIVAPADVHGDSLIAVGAVDLSGAPSSSSSWGPTADGRVKPDLAAHGVSVPIVSTGPDPEGYSVSSGTSLSAPLVSGLAACLIQARPHWTPQQVIRALRETASRFHTPDVRVGYGIPNGARALRWPEAIPDVPLAGRLGIVLAGANPFHPREGDLRVAFAAAGAVDARISIRDLAGRRVRVLWTGTLAAGRSRDAFWDGRDEGGREVVAGLYWITLESNDELVTRRVTVLR